MYLYVFLQRTIPTRFSAEAKKTINIPQDAKPKIDSNLKKVEGRWSGKLALEFPMQPGLVNCCQNED